MLFTVQEQSGLARPPHSWKAELGSTLALPILDTPSLRTQDHTSSVWTLPVLVDGMNGPQYWRIGITEVSLALFLILSVLRLSVGRLSAAHIFHWPLQEGHHV